MIKRIKLSFLVYVLSLILLIISLFALGSQFLGESYPILYMALLLTIYAGVYLSPILVVLLIIDSFLAKNISKSQYISFAINILIICTAFYFGYHAFENFPPLS